jgi:flagellar protein FliO/FliZ
MDFAEFLRAVAALAVTLGLVGLGAVIARKYGPEALARLPGLAARKDRRLKLLEVLMLDPQRRIVLFSLDGEERLILLGEGRSLDTLPKEVKLP